MGTYKVFVVEDSSEIREAPMDRLAELEKFEVVGHAETAQSAIEGVRKTEPAVLVLDLHLKEGSGYDVLKSLGNPPQPRIDHIVMFTNHSTPAHRHQALRLGANAFYDKSMEFEEMLLALYEWAT